MIVDVRFVGGPYDGLVQGWHVEEELPDELRISPSIGYSQGGLRLEVGSPSLCGVLEDYQFASDEVCYVQGTLGVFYYDSRPEATA